jgi:hypothetical protein
MGMIGIYFGAGIGAEHPWDWNLYCLVKQIIELGLSCQSVEIMKHFEEFSEHGIFHGITIW